MAAVPLRWYFDVLSPFAYLQWPEVRALQATHALTPVPILFGAVLDAHGQKGPAEIPGKREFTYRHVLWRAQQAGVPLRFPPAHPFNPLPLLRLVVAAGATAEAVDAVFAHVWVDGHGADDTAAFDALRARLGVAVEALSSDDVKSTLRRNTEDAIAAGVYGVPTLASGDELFWGSDAHDFALAVLADPALLETPEMRRVSSLPIGIRRG